MSVGHTDPLPLDVDEALLGLSPAADLSPAEVLREAIDLTGAQAGCRACRAYHTSPGRARRDPGQVSSRCDLA
jgi:hypothetical protein